jgi:tRNA (cmo5U34)-methyltransferase
LANTFPEATITFVDLSADSIDLCRRRLGTNSRFVYEQKDFRELAYKLSTFDLIASSISLHHLTSSEKETLYRHAFDWLRPRGLLTFADQFAGATAEISARHMENWKRISRDAGSTEDEWEMWMRHQADHDHHDSLADQLEWLTDAGFTVVDCPWRYLLWTVIQGRK